MADYRLIIKNKVKDNWQNFISVLIAGIIAFAIRIRPSSSVFLENGFVRFGGNDPWYHMRLVNVILENYPQQMNYNPMTNYPEGSFIHFGPLFDQILSLLIMVIGMGNPSTEVVNLIGAYFPALLGMLTVIPAYYIGKEIYSSRTGILAAFLIAFAPGQFLSRSILGFTDHHIAETLFSTLFIMFFIIAIKKANENNLNWHHIKNKDWAALKTPILFASIAGIMYAAYQLTWVGAPLFGLIVVIFAVLQYVLDHIGNRQTDYIGIVGITTFFIGLILILPHIQPEMGFSKFHYSLFHLTSLVAAIFAFVAMSLIDKFFKSRSLPANYYPLTLVGIASLGFGITKIVLPSMYSLIVNTPKTLFGIHTGGMATVAEASSIFYRSGIFTLDAVWYNFSTGFFISLLGIGLLIYKIVKDKKAENTIVLVWSIFILLTIYGQNRFAYYYSMNVAILSAYVGIIFLNLTGWDKLNFNISSYFFSDENLGNPLKKIKLQHIFSLLLVILILIIPSYNLAMEQSQYSGGPNNYWIETTQWLRYNTPDTGMDYYNIYDAPEKGEMFQYPDTAYGVMSWWDYGHWIETLGHRMPNANPFQAGIGGRRNSMDEENRPGASTFFTAPSETEATAVLEAVHPDPDKAGARYVVSDVEMATGKFYAMAAWTLDTDNYYVQAQTAQGTQTVPGERYFNTMEARLHIFDGDGLEQYRMVHETPAANTAESGYKQVYNVLFGGNVEVVNTGYVKIFEYVDGATITGQAPEGEKVTITNTIRTTTGRTFEYSQSTMATDGTYEFVVPYSTEGPMQGQTQFDTAPTGSYKVSFGDTTESVRVSESAILNGGEIEV